MEIQRKIKFKINNYVPITTIRRFVHTKNATQAVVVVLLHYDAEDTATTVAAAAVRVVVPNNRFPILWCTAIAIAGCALFILATTSSISIISIVVL